LHASAGGAVWLGQYQRDFKARAMQGLECRGGEFGCAGEDDFHGAFAFQRNAAFFLSRFISRSSFNILVLMRLRFKGDRYSTNTLPFK
jgi:hypothetical protein